MHRTSTLLAAAVMACLAAFAAHGRIAQAGPGGPIQPFTVDSAICYGAGPSLSLACPGASATSAPAATALTMHTVAHIEQGSRLGVPIVYTPGSFPFAAGTIGATVGDVTAQLDIVCDSTYDVISGGPDAGDPVGASGSEGPSAPWPDPAVWRPFPVKHQGVAPAGAYAYVNDIKPTPSTFTPLSYDRADLYSLWFAKSTPAFLPTIYGDTTPLHSVTEAYPASYGAPAGLRVSLSLFLGNTDTPTNSFLACLDTAQDSVQTSTQISTPTTPGLYARWTTWTSNADIRTANVSRIVDISCVNVGAAVVTDNDGDCLASTVDPDDNAADADGDLLVDGIEAEFGTSRTVADADGDGATDYAEMFSFTNPGAADSDGDGSLDKQDTGADEGTPDDTTADDNCPAIANASQTNTDFANDYNGTVNGDATVSSQDSAGDACDLDDDNDGLADPVEATMYLLAPSGANTTGWCKPDATGGGVLTPTSATDPDSDDDLGLDGPECKFDSNPMSSSSVMAAQPGDNLGSAASPPDAVESFYRTTAIAKTGGGQENNPDGDAFLNGVTDSDSDNDGLSDGLEVKFYGTHPANDDTDGDGCKDGTEAASVDGAGRAVNSIDLGQVAQRFGAYVPANEALLTPAGRVAYDYTKNKTIDAIDLGQVAQRFGSCGVQLGLTPADAKQ